jgi:hypothetical protein
MSQEPELSREQAEELMTRLVGGNVQLVLHQFEFGWLARRVLSEEERGRGMRLGQGSYIIDRTGVVTVQRSLSTRLLIKQYTRARREGRITGRQVWPTPEPTTPPR